MFTSHGTLYACVLGAKRQIECAFYWIITRQTSSRTSEQSLVALAWSLNGPTRITCHVPDTPSSFTKVARDAVNKEVCSFCRFDKATAASFLLCAGNTAV